MTDIEKAEESLEKRKGEYWCIKTDNVYIPYIEGFKDGLAEGRKEKCNLEQNKDGTIKLCELAKENAELRNKLEKVFEWVKEQEYPDGCIDCSCSDTEKLKEILKWQKI